MTTLFFTGAIFFGFVCASLFFVKYWTKTRDSLFILFALAFAFLAIERFLLAFVFENNEFKVYFIRILAFALILAGIFQKNRR